MKNYKATLLTDSGKRLIRVTADNEETARNLILQAESCPESAIQSIKEIKNKCTVLVATFDKGRKEAYTTIGQFCKYNPLHSKHTVHSWLSRHKKPYMHEGLILEKIILNK